VPELVLVRGQDGHLEGLGEKNARRYERFKRHVRGMDEGETVTFHWGKPRSVRFHRLYFAFLNQLFGQQETFEDVERLRDWLTLGARYVDFVPGPDGQLCALPKSIAFHSMEDLEFGEYVQAVWQFLRTPQAHTYLWPAIGMQRASEAVERLLLEFER
jgi:hypothetical protein